MRSRKSRHFLEVLRDHRWWSFYVQRIFMGRRVRRVLGRLAAIFRPRNSFARGPCEATFHHVNEMHAAGVSRLGRVLTANQAEELRTYFLGKFVSDPYRPTCGSFLPESDRRHPESHIAHHDPRDIVRAPYLFGLANDPLVLDVVARYLGCQPTLGYLAAWWSYRTEVGAQEAELFHRDVDDWRFVKLFVYLTDVREENGPHVYVSRSAVSPEFRRIRRFSDNEVVAMLGRENILEIKGDAGHGFLEDTFGLHKGKPVVGEARLIFQAVYSMFALPYGPRVPVISAAETTALHSFQCDPWINRCYVWAYSEPRR